LLHQPYTASLVLLHRCALHRRKNLEEEVLRKAIIHNGNIFSFLYYILMVTYYQAKSYNRLCSAHNVQTTSFLLAQPSNDVKLKISVLLTSPPKGQPNAEEILGPFSRFRRFKILRQTHLQNNFFRQFECFSYQNCGCELIPAEDRVDVTRRYKIYRNQFGVTKLSDVFNEIETNNPTKYIHAPLPLKLLALSVSQELHKRWVLSKKPSNYHYAVFRNLQQLLSEPPYNVPFSISRITLPSLTEPHYVEFETVYLGPGVTRLVPLLKFGIQPQLRNLYRKTNLSIPIYSWYILLQHLLIYNNIPSTRNCFTVLKELDNTHNRHEHKFPSKKNVDAVFKIVFARLSYKTFDNGNILDEYQLISIAHLLRIQNYSQPALERQFYWEQVFGDDHDDDEEVDELAVFLDEDINEFA